MWGSSSLRNLNLWKSTEQCSHIFVRFQPPYFVASGGQSGWLDGWAARNAGWFSSSRSIRNIMGNGRKSTWNLQRNQISSIYEVWIQYYFITRPCPCLTFAHWTLVEWGSSLQWIFHHQHSICQHMQTTAFQPLDKK